MGLYVALMLPIGLYVALVLRAGLIVGAANMAGMYGGARFVAPHVEEDYMRFLFMSILVVSLLK